MKKILIVAIAALLSTAAIAQNSYSIKGAAPAEHNGKTIYLYNYNTEKKIDSTLIADGAYELKGTITEPTICRLAITGTRTSADIIAENGIIEVNFAPEGTFTIEAKGLNSQYSKIINAENAFEAKLSLVMDSLKKVHSEDRQALSEAFSTIVTPMFDRMVELYDEDMKSNTNNTYGMLCVWKLSDHRAENLAQLDSLVAIVPGAKEFAPLKKMRDGFVVIEATGPGAMFKDFPAQTPDGKPTKLSDFVGKGKYVLVDFWASWCGPCIREIPNLKHLHETYPELVVLGVNVWDKHDKFLEALATKGMTWTSIYASHDRTATDLYGIKGIPTIILFAPDGTIVDRTLRGEQMKEYIAKLFAK